MYRPYEIPFQSTTYRLLCLLSLCWAISQLDFALEPLLHSYCFMVTIFWFRFHFLYASLQHTYKDSKLWAKNLGSPSKMCLLASLLGCHHPCSAELIRQTIEDQEFLAWAFSNYSTFCLGKKHEKVKKFSMAVVTLTFKSARMVYF